MKKSLRSLFKHKVIITSLASLLLLTSCGGGSDISSNTNVGSGIGGTGSGQITAFGSVFINDTRKFEVDDNTKVFIDDNPVSEAELRTRGLGLITRVDVATDVNADISAGTAVNIFADNTLKGPVTSIAPLQVFAQDVEITGDTVLVNTTGTNLVVGDIVEVSGYLGVANNIQALRLERKPNGTTVWKLSGTTNSVTSTSFKVGNQRVNIGSLTPRDCGAGGLQNGLNVEVKINPDNTFVAGDAIATAIDIECKNVALQIPAGAVSTTIKAEFEGIVSSVTGNPVSQLLINNQLVSITSTTTFEGGVNIDLIVGVKVEAEGVLDTNSGVLTANKIKFRQSRVRIEAPVDVPVGGLDSSFQIMQSIEVNIGVSTRNEVNNSGLQQIEVRGFVDKTGKVFAERVRDRGAADANDTRLRGPIANTNTASGTFTILGVTVDGNTAISIKDVNGNTITINQFLSQATAGTLVQVNNGDFTSSPALIVNGEIEIED